MQENLLVAAVVLLVVTLISLWTVFYQLIKQQGRLLLRLDAVERSLAQAGRGALPQGLPVGAPIAPFRLPDLKGREVGLEELKGKRVLLVHWHPGCGFCELIAPDLARLQGDLHRRNVQLLFVSGGDAEANRKLAEEHGL
jgi:hypothetical protein